MAGGLYALNSAKNLLPAKILRSIYFALIESHLNYGCLLWGNTCDKYLHKIKIYQKKAVRIMCHASYNAPATPLFRIMNVLRTRRAMYN